MISEKEDQLMYRMMPPVTPSYVYWLVILLIMKFLMIIYLGRLGYPGLRSLRDRIRIRLRSMEAPSENLEYNDTFELDSPKNYQ